MKGQARDARELSCSELNTLLINESPPIVLDILPPEHYSKVRLPSAVNACIFDAKFLDLTRDLFTTLDDPIVIYGAGQDSYDWSVAWKKLHHAGYTNLAVLKAGVEGWLVAGYPVDGSEKKIQKEERPLSITEGRCWEIDTEKSILEWRGRKNTGSHRGTIKVSGHLYESNGELRGNIVADMKSIQDLDLEGDPLKTVLESHLNSDDFFFTQLFPTAKFEIVETKNTKVQTLTCPQVVAKGILSIRGVSHSVEVPLLINELDETTISIEMHFDIDRTRWGIIYGSSRFFRHLMYHKVFDIISAQCQLYGVSSTPQK
ncbi:MAG: YceI family protein [Halodesulfovibrio sp.]|uniref:YceI family protein n=1 Tax=Halodesulfovibrio sp. TaxID=1912772 RepID=UPI00359D2579